MTEERLRQPSCVHSNGKRFRAKSAQIESRFRSKYLFGRMILSEKSATFQDDALALQFRIAEGLRCRARRAFRPRLSHYSSFACVKALVTINQLQNALLFCRHKCGYSSTGNPHIELRGNPILLRRTNSMPDLLIHAIERQMLQHAASMKKRVVEEGIVGTPEDGDFLRLPCLIPSSHEPNENRGVHIDDKGPLILFRGQSVIMWEQVLMRNVVDVFLHAEKAVEYIPRKEYRLDRQLTAQLQSSLFLRDSAAARRSIASMPR